MSDGRCDITRRTLSFPAVARDGRAHGDRKASIALAWNQARLKRSGGRSRREARPVGRRQRGGNGRQWPAASSRSRSTVARAALLLTGPTDGASGSPGSPQGAESRHGSASTRSDLGGDSESGGRIRSCRGRQQHDVPWHLVPHLQSCGAASMPRAEETSAAEICPLEASATSSTAAMNTRQGSSIRFTRRSGFTRGDLRNPRVVGRWKAY